MDKTNYFPSVQTINDIITRLTAIVQQCEARQMGAGYFAALYKRMTIAVAEGIQNNLFEDAARMERLDVNFANRYLDAFDAYHSARACSPCWKFVFDCCNKNDDAVIQHLLLGMNAHINLDLAIAAAITAPGNSVYALQNDFNKINQLIAGLANDVQEALCKVWFPMRWLTKIANGKQMALLNFSVDKARAASWANALLLSKMDALQQQVYTQEMNKVVCLIGNDIDYPGRWLKFLLKIIRLTEYNNIARTIQLIDTTIV